MMTAEQLKGAILQLAMQGNLVEQRTSEREVVFKKGKSKETEELDFEIPMTWITAHLETVVDSVASKQYQIKESEVKPEGEYRVISQSKEYSIGYCNDKSKLYHHEQPVIVFGDHTTEVKFIDFDFIVGADGIKIFNPNIDIIEPRFLFYQLQFYARGLNKVGGYSRHYKFIKNKPIVIPPLAEQKRIVAKIEELMPFVDQYAAASTKLNALNASFPEMMKKSILQEAVQGKLVPQDSNDEPASLLLKKIAEEKKRLIKEGKIKKQKPLPDITEDEIPFDIPESWEWVRLGSILKLLTDGTHKTPHYVAEGVPFISVKDMSSGSISFSNTKFITEKEADELNTRCNPERGDVLLSKVGTTGVPAPVDTNIKFSLFVSVALLKFNTDLINRDYLINVINSPCVQKQCAENTRGVGNKNWVMRDIANTLIPIAPLREQERIVIELKRIIPQVSILEQKMER